MSTPTSDNNLVRLDHQLCFALYAASRAMTRAYQPMLADLGLTYPQYLVLMVLWEWHDSAPEEPTVTALGQRLLLDSGTLTPLLKRMEQQGLVMRQRDSIDERRVFLRVTDAGLALQPRAVQWVCMHREQLPATDEFIVGLRADLRRLLEIIS